MPALLDALRGRMKQRELNAIDTIAEAARAAARGESYDVTAIEHAIVETRLTADDFEQAVETARKRMGWLRDFDKLAASTNRFKKIESAIAAEQTRFEDVRRAFMQKIEALDADLASARTARDAGQTARGHLLDARGVPGTIGEKYRAAVADAEAAEQTLAGMRRQLREIDQRIKSEQGWIEQLTGEQEKELKPDRIIIRSPEPPQQNYKIEDHRRALARAQRQRAEIEGQLVEAERAAARTTKAVEALIPEVLKT